MNQRKWVLHLDLTRFGDQGDEIQHEIEHLLQGHAYLADVAPHDIRTWKEVEGT